MELEVAARCRRKGLDPELEPESALASDLAGRVERLTGPPGVAQVIREFEKHSSGREELAMRVVSHLLSSGSGVEQAVRTALAILTEGVVSAPVEGITKVETSPHVSVGFAGPIRAAGGTAAALTVLVADLIRQRLGLPRWKPTPEQVKLMVAEVDQYNRKVSPLQYVPSPQEVELVASNLPVEVTGDSVKGIREGMVLVLAEGIILKAPKLLKYSQLFKVEGWGWLEELVKLKKKEAETEAVYLRRVLGGRPIFSHPGSPGGFRLRYGRARNTGLAALGLHPATMELLGLAVGTQLVVEGPGKAGAVAPVDSIEGPTVRTSRGVRRLRRPGEVRREEVEEILFLGDLLVSTGEFVENNKPFLPAGYCEEQWACDLKAAAGSLPPELERYATPPYPAPPAEEALSLSRRFGVPLHPAHTPYFSLLDSDQLLELARRLERGWRTEEGLMVRRDGDTEYLLAKIGAEYEIRGEELVIPNPAIPLCLNRRALEEALGGLPGDRRNTPAGILEAVSKAAGFPVRDKAGTWIGGRMGRPEKAAPRLMDPPPHVLFPIGEVGGPQRDILKAKGRISLEVVNRVCPACGEWSPSALCPTCGRATVVLPVCPQCGSEVSGSVCPSCRVPPRPHSERKVDLPSLLAAAKARVGQGVKILKGVKGLVSEDCTPEPLEKGILRARHGLAVFRDGTVRFDATNLPLTHFTPREVGTPVEKLRELGYTEDYLGRPLESEDQLVELKWEDVILPRSAGEWLVRVSQFVDEELRLLYGEEEFYRAGRPEDLVGHRVVTLAPHTSCGLIQRIVGFTDTNVMYCHPFAIATRRRDADGDADSCALLLDVLLNFSRHYLPSSRGGMMDAPLLLLQRVNPKEMDKEALNVEADWSLEGFIREGKTVLAGEALKGGGRLGFTTPTTNIQGGPKECGYREEDSMEAKVRKQLDLARKIRAVDEKDLAVRILESHLIPDLVGNLKAYFRQQFRCTACGARYRRPLISLRGRCRCGKTLIPTVTEGGIRKYLELAEALVPSRYQEQRIWMIRRVIDSFFGGPRQVSLESFEAGEPGEAIQGPEESPRRKPRETTLADFLQE